MTERNAVFARTLVAALAASGVEHACVAPGSRSSPLSLALADSPIHDWSHHDERSAAFFALGIAKTTGRPTVVVTTSGTAATEIHPAVAEAGASNVPLIALTADRPSELFDVGASQTIDQRGLFGFAVRWAHDLEVPNPTDAGPDRTAALAARLVSESTGLSPGPVHLNIRFREPLLIGGVAPVAVQVPQVTRAKTSPDPAALSDLVERVSGKRGLIVAGPQTDRSECGSVAELGAALGWPIMSDPISGLRSGPHNQTAVVGSDLLAAAGWLDTAPPDFVIRTGARPTSKALTQWLAANPQVPQVVVAAAAWPDPMASAQLVLRGGLASLGSLASAQPAPAGWLAQWKAADTAAAVAAAAGIDSIGGLSEPAVVSSVCDAMPPGSMLWAASSMPIRDVDSFLPASDRDLRIHANRGANGIDGFISTALGAATVGSTTVALTGDLSMLHDVGALAAMARLEIPLTAVVLNNDGGGIFHFLPQADHEHFERHFGTPHGLSFSEIGRSFGVDAVTVADTKSVADIVSKAGERPQLVEVVTDRVSNVQVHREILAKVEEALHRQA